MDFSTTAGGPQLYWCILLLWIEVLRVVNIIPARPISVFCLWAADLAFAVGSTSLRLLSHSPGGFLDFTVAHSSAVANCSLTEQLISPSSSPWTLFSLQLSEDVYFTFHYIGLAIEIYSLVLWVKCMTDKQGKEWLKSSPVNSPDGFLWSWIHVTSRRGCWVVAPTSVSLTHTLLKESGHMWPNLSPNLF